MLLVHRTDTLGSLEASAVAALVVLEEDLAVVAALEDEASVADVEGV